MTLAGLPRGTCVRCPFCGCERIRLHSYSQRGMQYQMQCLGQDCGALGPRRYEAEEALQAWNSRDGFAPI